MGVFNVSHLSPEILKHVKMSEFAYKSVYLRKVVRNVDALNPLCICAKH
jgi:hypothetical protein